MIELRWLKTTEYGANGDVIPGQTKLQYRWLIVPKLIGSGDMVIAANIPANWKDVPEVEE